MSFFDKVYKYTKMIPRGKVASYGQIAALCGSPRAARQVGWALSQISDKKNNDVPWQRVINSKGYISIANFNYSADLQKELLEKEGVEVVKKQEVWTIELDKFLWQPKAGK